MTQKIIFLRWLPWSGKSTWSRQYILDNPNTIRVNKDDIRMQLHNWVFSKSNEIIVLEYQMSLAATALAEGKSVIVDNTHLSGTHEQDYRQLANDMDVEFEIKSFLDVPLSVCLERNSKREWIERVPDEVILSMAKKMGIRLEEPPEFEKVIQSETNKPCIIVDIDWTIAKMEWRSPYDYSKVITDSVHWDIVKLIEYYCYGYENEMWIRPSIIIVSWRKDECRGQTEEWLEWHKIQYSKLLMRKTSDTRKDSYVKYDILNEIVKDYRVLMSIDDRDQVVKMMREAWIRCLQVANGNF